MEEAAVSADSQNGLAQFLQSYLITPVIQIVGNLGSCASLSGRARPGEARRPSVGAPGLAAGRYPVNTASCKQTFTLPVVAIL